MANFNPFKNSKVRTRIHGMNNIMGTERELINYYIENLDTLSKRDRALLITFISKNLVWFDRNYSKSTGELKKIRNEAEIYKTNANSNAEKRGQINSSEYALYENPTRMRQQAIARHPWLKRDNEKTSPQNAGASSKRRTKRRTKSRKAIKPKGRKSKGKRTKSRKPKGRRTKRRN